MSELPPGCKEFKLPAGSLIKIGDTPFTLKDDSVVIGANQPKWLSAPVALDQFENSTAQNTTDSGARQ